MPFPDGPMLCPSVRNEDTIEIKVIEVEVLAAIPSLLFLDNPKELKRCHWRAFELKFCVRFLCFAVSV